MRTLAAIFLVTWSFRLAGYLTFGTWVAVPVALMGLTGLLALVAAWLPGGSLASRRLHQIDLVILAAVIVALGIWCYFQIYTAPDYGTDEVAFDQYAAQLALHGINPYLHSMAAAFPLFHVSPNGYTFLLNGQPVTNLSYPALAFEQYLPLLAMGLTTQAAVWTDVAAWALGALVLYAVLPRKLAPLAAVMVSLDVFTGYAVGGVTDFLFMPLLIGAAAGWDRFAWTRGPAAWRGPVLMGLAMAVKQTPWLIVPFVVAGIVLESRRLRNWTQALRDGVRYLGIAAVAFLVPNLPYLLNAPGAWLSGILTPVTAQTVPAGQGLVSLSLSLPLGGGSLRDFNYAALVVLARPAGLLPGHLSGAQAGRLPAPVDRAVLRHPFLRELPGHADPGGGGGRGDHAARGRRGDHAAPAALRVLAALEMGGLRRGVRLRPGRPRRADQPQPAGHGHPVGPHHRPASHRGPGDHLGHQPL